MSSTRLVNSIARATNKLQDDVEVAEKSRLLRPKEARYYALIEGEALAIAWFLELVLIVTDHKPLAKLFSDRTLDETTNTLCIKQKTLLWRFSIQHMPGKDNHFSEASSCYPVDDPPEDINHSDVGFTSQLYTYNNDDSDIMEDELAADIRAITWDLIRSESAKDQQIQALITAIASGISFSKDSLPVDIQEFWKYRDELCIVDGVVLRKKRIVVPKLLRPEVFQSLHAAHQGVAAMNKRAKVELYWPGITYDIQTTRDNCYDRNCTAASQAKLPLFEPTIPTTPFEALTCDYFLFTGWYYLVSADRLSCWTAIFSIRQGTSESGSFGSFGPCSALRKMFSTFDVPVKSPAMGVQNSQPKTRNLFFDVRVSTIESPPVTHLRQMVLQRSLSSVQNSF